MSDSRRRRRPVLEAMEPRVLYSADLAPVAAAASLAASGTPDALAVAGPVNAVPSDTSHAQQAAEPARELPRPVEVAVIDLQIAGADRLIADIESQRSEGREIWVVAVDTRDDGIAAVSAAIDSVAQAGGQVSAIHLIGHGDSSGTTIGSARLDLASLRSRAPEFAQWAGALTADADLLLYGCDLAGDADGQSLVQGLAALTGADVAASTDRTGAAALGGDWSLEYQTGAIESPLAVSEAERAAFDAVLASFTVTNTNDSGAGSLRQAITSANLNGGVDIIFFAIAGGGVQTINLLSALPTITDQVTINGTTQLGWSGTPLIELNGASAGALANGLSVSLGGTNTVINGLIINRFGGNGILVDGADQVKIHGNYIGTSSTGLADQGNGLDGIQLQNGAADTEIGGLASWQRNIIAGNNNAGIAIDGATTSGTLILGNYVGLGADGLTAIGNSHDGIHLQAATLTTIGSATDTNGRNVISGNLINGIGLDSADNTTIVGNYIGTSASGLIDLGNTLTGVLMNNGAQNNVIGGTTAGARNVISGNNENGISINTAGSQGNQVIGNYIGVDATGNADLGNALVGVAVGQSADSNIIGSAGGGRNVISGNDQYGVRIVDAGTDDNLIQNNLIGLNAAGNAAIGNGSDGIRLEAAGALTGTVIGGTTAGLGNVISGNAQNGIDAEANITNLLIAGNLIGTDVAGLADLGNTGHGIHLSSNTAVTIGGTGAAERNVISGNNNRGINVVNGTAHRIQGNYIGVGADGLTALGNGYDGVGFNATVSALLGGATAGAGNIIANHTGTNADGIFLTSNATGISILGNSIYNSNDAGIEFDQLAGAGTDALDADTGNNNLQNFPVLTAASTSGTTTTITGSLGAAASTTYRIEFFANRSGSQDASGYGEGRYFLGATSVTTNGSGSAAINAVLNNVRLAAGDRVTATATVDLGGGSYGDTSEFSANIFASSYIIAVTNNNDTANGNTTSISALAAADGGDGVSLREAITAANNTSNAGGVNEIWFAVGSAGGPVTITPASALPTISDAVVVDGRTQPGYTGTPIVALDGNNLGGNGLTLGSGSDGSTIRGLIVRDFIYGIEIAVGSDNNQILGNYLGQLNTAGGDAGVGEGNGIGLLIQSDSNQVGGPSAEDRNVISGNSNGIVVQSGSANTIAGNYIGTDATGTLALGNAVDGVRLLTSAVGNIIGGSAPADRNVISANGQDGIEINGEASDNNIIRGNYIGTNAAGTGTGPLGNAGDGIFIFGGPDGNLIGGTGVNDRNLIASSGLIGIEFDGASSGNIVQGNRIGTDAGGTALWGSQENGILFENGSFDNLVGGTTAGAGNVVAFSGQGGLWTSGISISASAGGDNTVLANAVYGSVGIGLDVGAGGVTVNDVGDPDSGGNDGQNFPVISAATLSGSDLYVSFSLDTDLSNAQYRIEFFGNAAGTEDASHGEGRVRLGVLDITTNGSGDYIGSNMYLASTTLVVGDYLTATATQIDSPAQLGVDDLAAFGSTSEYAQNRQITLPNTAPAIAFGEGAKTYIENTPDIIVDASATVTDPDSGDFDSGHLVVSITANAETADLVSVRHQGSGAGQIGVSGNSLSYGGIGIGTFVGGSGATPLDITLNANADAAAVQALMRSIQYQYQQQDPTTQARTIEFVLSDGDGGTSAAITKTITVLGDHDIWVTTTSDVADGDTSSFDALLADRGADGQISLREAIIAANNTANGAGPDQILFNISAPLVGGAHTISPGTDLPTIIGAVIIDGSSEPDFSGSPVIEIEGSLAGASVTGLALAPGSGGSTIRGLVINRFEYAITIDSTSAGNLIVGNRLGTSVDGLADLGNSHSGLYVLGDGNTIGGDTAAERNLISGNDGYGVYLGAGANNNVLTGNWIGVDATGNVALTNTFNGIYLGSNISNRIGGTAFGEGNVISGHPDIGVRIEGGSGHTIQGNWIGVGANGSTPLGNLVGVSANFGATDIVVGGTAVGSGNRIYDNGRGVLIQDAATQRVNVLGNRIDSSNQLGIDIGGDGVSANDVSDADTGPNGRQNFPVLTAASSGGTVVEIAGTLDSAADSRYRIEFFYDAAPNLSNHGEAAQVIGAIEVRTDASGHAPIHAILNNITIPAGAAVTATATELLAGGAFGGTSEFALNVTATAASVVIVDTTADLADGDTSSIVNLLASRGADGKLSLREAIAAANNSANAGGADRIVFAIPTSDPNYNAGTGVFTITLGSLLPSLDESVIIDGVSQSQLIGDSNAGQFGTGGVVGVDALSLATVARPEIQIVDGAALSTGIDISAADTTVRGLSIHGFDNDIEITVGADRTLIEGNVLGSAAAAIGDPGPGNRSLTNLRVMAGVDGVVRNNLAGFTDNEALTLEWGVSNWRIEGNEVLGGGLANTAYDALTIWSDGHTVVGNRFADSPGSGIDIDGDSRFTNNTVSNVGFDPGSERHAIRAQGNAAVTIDRNLVVNSPYRAISVIDPGTQAVISQNSISGSGGIGIDLNANDVSPNDIGDGDAGPNQGQNYPVLSTAISSGGNTTITGSLNSTPLNVYRVEFFSSATADPSGYGEGQTYLGSTTVSTSAGGNATINTTLIGVTVPSGHVVTATATLLAGGTAPVYTSEFSAAIATGGNTLTVDTTSDLADGDTASISALLANRGADGKISLREAITATNNTANTSGPDLIEFEILDPLVGGAHTITPLTSLPTLTDAVIIDGSTDGDFAGTPVIVIDGNGLGGNGLTVNGGNSTIRGLVVARFGASGIAVNTAGGNTIAGNYIGTDVTGSLDRGNTGSGIYIGTANNTIGGTSAADRNVISGNDFRGIDMVGAAAAANQVLGNYIGLNSAGDAALGNGNVGVEISGGAHDNTIGGIAAGARNIVSGNGWAGVEVAGGGSNANLIFGNYIGTDVTGTVAIGNTAAGVSLFGGVSGNQVGGTTAAHRNIIAGNGREGIFIGTTSNANLIRGNYIGSDVTGTVPLGNALDGIRLEDAVHSNTVGGVNPGEGNVIAFSGERGVNLFANAGSLNAILGNSIHNNTLLGIDLGADGVTANDAGDSDAGPNSLQNYPTLVSATVSGGDLQVTGNFSGAASTNLRIELFSSPAGAGDASGFGEAHVYLGAFSLTTDGAGNAPINALLTGVSPALGSLISATASVDIGGGYYVNTSEFSGLVAVSASNTAPSIVFGGGAQTFIEGGLPILIDATATVTDPDSADFDGGHLVVDVPVNGWSGDTVAIRHEGLGAGQVGVSGNAVFYGGVQIGTFSGAGAPLDVAFNSSASLAAVQAVMRNISFESAEDPSSLARTVRFVLSDGDGGTSAAITKTVSITFDRDLWVTTAGDTADGDTSSIAALLADRGADGFISLREAIAATNNTANAGGPDQIHFDIAAPLMAGAHTIALASALPTVTDALVIDASTEPDFAGTPVVALDGLSAGAVDGLTVSAANSTIRGLSIQRFIGSGIRLIGASGAVIEGNYLGVGVDGATDRSNAVSGIRIDGGSGIVVGGATPQARNVIIASGARALELLGGASANAVTGNYIGTNAAGSASLGTTLTGVHFFGTTGAGNTIGGSAAGEGNVIAGSYAGIDVQSGTQVIEGNIVGLNATQTAAIGGTSMGVVLYGSGSVVGGTVAGAGNVLSGNGIGLAIAGGGASGNTVSGNFIGTNAAGTVAFGNSIAGVDITSGASGNTIGGGTAAHRNIVSGNAGAGIRLQGAGTSGNQVQGNYIGTNAAGAAALPNAEGVLLEAGADGNTIGGAAGLGNRIAGNTTHGVRLSATSTTTLLGNQIGAAGLGNGGDGIRLELGAAQNVIGSTLAQNTITYNAGNGITLTADAGSQNNLVGFIAFNGGLAIDLGNDGVTPNDALDADSGPNGLQNYPVLLAANTTGTELTVIGSLSAAPSTTYEVSVFSNSAADPSGYGESETFVRQFGVTTDAAGNAQFISTGAASVAPGTVLSARARIDYGGGVLADFSEMSQNVVAATPGIRLTSVTPFTTTEAGASSGFSIELDTRPAADVTIAFASSDTTEGTVSTSSLTFTPANWNVAQPVTITGVDDLFVDGNVAFTIVTGAAVSADPMYNGIDLFDPGFVNNDNDTANALVVTNVSDLVNGDTSSIAALVASDGGDGVSLREAITAVNNTANAGGNPDAIVFSIADPLVAGEHRIVLGSMLPALTDAVIIDAGTEPDYAGVPVVVLDGALAGAGADGLRLFAGSGGSTIRALGINGFAGDGIAIAAGSGVNVVAGNRIWGQGANGVTIQSAGNRIGGTALADRNAIETNAGSGINLSSATATGNLVQGNVIGTDPSGLIARGNGVDGIRIVTGASNNTIGGTVAGSRNLVSGNTGAGVRIDGSGTQGNLVLGNWIGVDATGNAALGNALDGILLINSPASNTIGGTLAAQGNLISGNLRDGVNLNAGTSGTQLLHNWIGLGADGTTALGNGRYGVLLNSATANAIGAANAGNVISANAQYGVLVTGASNANTLSGNFIGTDEPGLLARGNQLDGIYIHNASSGNIVGGSAPGQGNVIAGNLRHGLFISDAGTDSNQVLDNLIGTDATGLAALGNGMDGILVSNGAAGTLIGSAAAGNVVSGNLEDGIQLNGGATGSVVAGNVVGLSANGSTDLGNGRYGVSITNSSTGNTIGGAAAGEGNTVSGNAIHGILVTLASHNNVVIGNRVGTDVTGTLARPNDQYGVFVSNASNVRIGGTAAGEGNLISGNGTAPSHGGIGVASADAPLIQGNRIGTTADGLAALGNAGDGIAVSNTTNALIGGSSAAARNLISGNGAYGIQVSGASASANRIQGNFIGTDATGLLALGNASAGVLINGSASGNTVGGSAPGEGNVISGNNLRGVYLSGAGTQANSVLGNWIGVGTDGTTVVANAGFGVLVNNNASNNLIGDAGAGNVIAGNTNDGLRMQTGASGNSVRGNRIGTDAGGTLNLANGGDGVQLDAVTGNVVGGLAAGEGNTIARNAGSGVSITGGASASLVIGNATFGNAGLGIDLGGDGVTADDTADADAGENALQNHGLLATAALGAGQLWLQGTLDSAPLASYRIAVYASAAPDASGFGEGERFIGYADVPTDAGGLAQVRFVLAAPGVALGETITWTATDLATNDTSEFGNVVTVQVPGVIVTPLGPNSTTEGGGTASYAFSLNFAPTADVLLPLGSSDATEASAAPSGLTLTTANWHQPQLVTLTGLQDFVTDGNAPYQFVIGPAASADGLFNGLDPADVALVNLELPNAPPLLGLPGAQTIDEDGSLVLSAAAGNPITIDDPDAGVQPLRLSLSFANAPVGSTITLASTAGLTFAAGDGMADAAVIVTGTRADLGAALDGLVVTPSPDAQGNETLLITLDDLGNSGSGGAQSAGGTVQITINPINDGPTLQAPASIAVDEDTTVVFGAAQGTAIVVGDVDAAAAGIELRIAASHGTVTLAGSAGLALLTGTGQGDTSVVVRGTVAAINAALDGATFAPEANHFGAAALSLEAEDLGNSGSGASLSASARIDVTLTSVNDAPTALIRTPALVLSENSPTGTTAGSIVPEDPDDAAGFVFDLIDDSGHFRIDPASGLLSVRSLELPDYTTQSSFQIVVRVSDPQGAFIDRTFVIQAVPKTVVPPPPPPREVGTPAPLAGPAPSSNPNAAQTSVSAVVAADPAAQAQRAMAAGATDRDDAVERRRPPNLMLGIRSQRTDETAAAKANRAAADEERRVLEMLNSTSYEPAQTGARRVTEFRRLFELQKLERQREDLSGSEFATVLRQQIHLPSELFNWSPEAREKASYSVTVEAVQVSGAVVSLGLLVYALRAGGLVAAMLTALPAWSGIDPLVVLARDRKRDDWGDDLATEMAADEAGIRGVIDAHSRFSSTMTRH